jgi:hypothetical protein
MWGTINAAAAVQNLDDLPVLVLWAGSPSDTHVVKRALRDELATLSTNTLTLFVEGAGHASILGNELYAQQVSDAILKVIEVAQRGKLLAQ